MFMSGYSHFFLSHRIVGVFCVSMSCGWGLTFGWYIAVEPSTYFISVTCSRTEVLRRNSDVNLQLISCENVTILVKYGYTRVRVYELLIFLVGVPSSSFKVPPCALVSQSRWRVVADVMGVVFVSMSVAVWRCVFCQIRFLWDCGYAYMVVVSSSSCLVLMVFNLCLFQFLLNPSFD
ncbi:unnamed protein product [Eruca vesicaria subsp. sativa]|uniref:Transmembrane protein n=1 Tax=Eruca vesicaria subsp. sativa TaxID=29727 RepID=A0ABC8L1X1_ERUVS|nr:unnamed protein product [Eruca vesicaria subsp. sativa]